MSVYDKLLSDMKDAMKVETKSDWVSFVVLKPKL